MLASLKSEDAIIHGPRYLPFIDFVPNLDAWRFILFDRAENLRRPLLNSLFISAIASGIVIITACMMIYAATRIPNRTRIKNLWLLWATQATRVLAPVTIVIPLYQMAQLAHLLDTQLILILVYSAVNLPVAIWLLLPVFGNRATEQEESAMLEGCSHAYVLRHILMPMVVGNIASVALIVFTLCWNEYLFAAYLTTDHASTLTPWMVGQLSIKEAQVGSEAEEWAHLSAATVLMAAPLLLFTSLVHKVLARRIIAK